MRTEVYARSVLWCTTRCCNSLPSTPKRSLCSLSQKQRLVGNHGARGLFWPLKRYCVFGTHSDVLYRGVCVSTWVLRFGQLWRLLLLWGSAATISHDFSYTGSSLSGVWFVVVMLIVPDSVGKAATPVLMQGCSGKVDGGLVLLNALARKTAKDYTNYH